MADIAQVLVAGGTTIIGVAVGAGLTYWFNTLNRRHQEAREDRNRRHQEAREDRTRWYEARREAYASMLMAVSLYHRTWTAQADEGGELTEKGLNELQNLA
jgi:ABC-type branched-subunit amino acid transport system permease subunit